MKRMLTFIACCIITGVSSAGYGSDDFTPGYRVAAKAVGVDPSTAVAGALRGRHANADGFKWCYANKNG